MQSDGDEVKIGANGAQDKVIPEGQNSGFSLFTFN